MAGTIYGSGLQASDLNQQCRMTLLLGAGDSKSRSSPLLWSAGLRLRLSGTRASIFSFLQDVAQERREPFDRFLPLRSRLTTPREDEAARSLYAQLPSADFSGGGVGEILDARRAFAEWHRLALLRRASPAHGNPRPNRSSMRSGQSQGIGLSSQGPAVARL